MPPARTRVENILADGVSFRSLSTFRPHRIQAAEPSDPWEEGRPARDPAPVPVSHQNRSVALRRGRQALPAAVKLLPPLGYFYGSSVRRPRDQKGEPAFCAGLVSGRSFSALIASP